MRKFWLVSSLVCLIAPAALAEGIIIELKAQAAAAKSPAAKKKG